MFELFTPEARDAVMEAQIEARELAHDHVGPEHLLLGLLRLPIRHDTRVVALEPTGLGPRVLADLGITSDRVRDEIHAMVRGSGPGFTDEDAEALRSIGIDVNEVRRRVEETFGPGALDVPASAGRQSAGAPAEIGLGFTSSAKQVMEMAVIQSIRLGHRHIGAEHLLLGLPRPVGSAQTFCGPSARTVHGARPNARTAGPGRVVPARRVRPASTGTHAAPVGRV